MAGPVITRRRDGYRFRLVASHTGTAPVYFPPSIADNCEGCGTRSPITPPNRDRTEDDAG